ncbi:MAG: trigger factor [Trueperaceae bacterium]|nr:trigger factor [Trueperaceae bacterium]
METTLKDKQSVKATIEVTADQAEVDAAFDKVIATYARQVRVPGFRPGKAPRGVLVKRIGEEALAEEVREVLIDDGYPQAIREHDLTAIHAHAHGGNPSQGEPFAFELHLDLYPVFELPELSEIVLDTDPEPIGEEQVEETVENLRREHATQVPVDRPAQAGDLVLIETVGADDAPTEEGSVMPVDLETVGEELAQQLFGHGIGDVVELQLDDPSTSGDEDAPAPTTMRIRISDVKAKEKPDADDEFAKTLGFDTWGEVDTAIRTSLAGQAKERADEERREEFVEKLMEHTEVELPPYLVNRRKMQLLENLARDLQRQGMQMDAYLKKLEEDGKREEFDGELQESAERGVKRDLVLEKLLEVRPVEVSEDEFRDAVRYLASREGMDPEALRRERGEEWLRNYHFLMMRDKALRTVVDELASGGASDGPSDGAAEAAPGSEPRGADPADSTP